MFNLLSAVSLELLKQKLRKKSFKQNSMLNSQPKWCLKLKLRGSVVVHTENYSDTFSDLIQASIFTS
jgi:hypothetical protein